jgi:hypothetical protein
MDTFDQFLTETSSSDVECVESFVNCIRGLAEKYNRTTLLNVWSKVSNGKGDDLVKEIIRNPSKSSSDLRKLVQKK